MVVHIEVYGYVAIFFPEFLLRGTTFMTSCMLPITLPDCMGSTLLEKNLLLGSKFFYLRVDP